MNQYNQPHKRIKIINDYFLIKMSDDIVYTFAITSSTYSTEHILSTPINLDQNRFDYYIRLNTISFSKVSPNVQTNKTLKVNNDTYIIKPGLYDFESIKAIFDNACYDEQSGYQFLTLEYNHATGKAFIKNYINDELVNYYITIDDNSILSKSTGILNFDNGYYHFTKSKSNLEADTQIRIEDYNNYWLSSNLINACSYQLDENKDVLHLGKVLSVLPSNAAPYEFTSFFSPQVLDYKISAPVIDRIAFNITKEYFKELPILEGSETDLSICVQLVRKRKVYE